MNKLWTIYFVLGGIISALILAVPGIIIIAIVFGPLFILLMFLPTIYLYSLALTLFLFLTNPLGILRWVLAPAMVAALAFGLPYLLNQTIYEGIGPLTKDDIEILSPLKAANTIALIDTRGYINVGDRGACQHICQQLLYNNVFKNVVVARSFDDHEASKYYIERRENCPAVPHAIEPVSLRIAKGECLSSRMASVNSENVDIVYELSRSGQTPPAPRNGHMDLRSFPILTQRIQVIMKQGNKDVILHQKTEVKARPLSYPFFIGPTGGYQLDFKTGLGRSSYVQNDFEKILKDESKKIFGDSLFFQGIKKQDEALSPENRALIIKAFNSSGPDKQQGHFLFEQYIMGFWQGNKRPTKEDVELVIMALKDDREDKLTYLDSFIHKLDNIPDELIEEVANRIIRTRKPFDVAYVIRNLPEKRAAVIYPQLEKIINDEGLRDNAWPAVTRLGDGGEKALPYYISILKEYEDRDLETYFEDDEEIFKEIFGPIIGLCYMGKGALPAKELLLSMIGMNKPRNKVNIMIFEALIQMGAEEELKEKFRGNEDILTQIDRIIRKNESYSKNQRPNALRGYCRTAH